MRKWTFWETLWGIKRPKSYSKEVQEQIRNHTRIYVRNYGRVNWVSTADIAKWMLESKIYNFNEPILWRWLGINYGLRGEIAKATHYWRDKGYPLISGRGKKGYRWADENCSDIAEVWEDGFRGLENRKDNYNKEKRRFIQILEKIIEKVTNPEEKQKLKEILIKCQTRNRRVEEEEEE